MYSYDMKKELQERGDGLTFYFTKKECELNNLKKGNILNITDEQLKEASESQ